MSITLQYSTTTIDLPADLYWPDENWCAVEQEATRAITGGMIVQTAERDGGRPITLQSEDGMSAWIDRATIDTLRTWANVPGRQMTLTLRGVSYTVIFRHQDGYPIEATPIIHFSDVQPGDFYNTTLRFMEI